MMFLATIFAPFLVVSGQAVVSEQPAVLRAALSWFSRDAPLCVNSDLSRAPFEGVRGEFFEYVDGDPARMPTKAQRRERYLARFSNWSAIDGVPLSAVDARPLIEAASALAEAGPVKPLPYDFVGNLDGSGPPAPPPRAFGKVRAAWLAPGEVLGTGERSRCRVLTLSAVAVHGDIAFVDTGLIAAPLSGGGAIYALRRAGGTWRVIAYHPTWIS